LAFQKLGSIDPDIVGGTVEIARMEIGEAHPKIAGLLAGCHPDLITLDVDCLELGISGAPARAVSAEDLILSKVFATRREDARERALLDCRRHPLNHTWKIADQGEAEGRIDEEPLPPPFWQRLCIGFSIALGLVHLVLPCGVPPDSQGSMRHRD